MDITRYKVIGTDGSSCTMDRGETSYNELHQWFTKHTIAKAYRWCVTQQCWIETIF